jgi:hypothetical protein
MRTVCLFVVLVCPWFAGAVEPAGIILQFNGKAVGDAKASTKDKAFKPLFEKDLQAIAEKLPGKPKLTIKAWFAIINGGAIQWEKLEKGSAEKLKAELEKLPYVKHVEFDLPTPPPG